MVLPPPRLPGAGISGRRPSTHFYNPCTSCSLWRTWRTLLCKSLCPCVIQLQCVAPIDVHQHALLSLRAAEAALMARAQRVTAALFGVHTPTSDIASVCVGTANRAGVELGRCEL